MAEYAHTQCLYSKLKQPDVATALFGTMIEKAKKLEPLIVKEANDFGFSWGGSINPNEEESSGLRVSG